MRARTALLGALTALLVAAAAASAQEPGTYAVTESGLARFPERAYIIQLPEKKALTLAQVDVTENGDTVSKPSLVSATGPGSSFGTLLVIDASNSMRGRPIEDAMVAARAFAARNPNRPLGVILFNDEATTLLPFTVDKAAIDQALSTVPDLDEGTRIYDALEAAVRAIDGGDLSAASIVLLSDGDDVGSKADPEEVLGKLQERKLRTFTVGLASEAFTPAALEEIASETDATYTQASSSAGLEAVYDELGYKLSNEYLLRYRSLAGPDDNVHVRIAVDGYPTTRFTYTSPGLPENALAPYQQSFLDSFVQSGLALLLVAAGIIALLAWALVTILRGPRRTLRARMSAFVDIRTEEEAEARRADVAALVEERRRRRPFSEWAPYAAFAHKCEVARISLSPGMIVLFTVVGTLVAGIGFTVLLGSALAFVLGFLVPVGVHYWSEFRLDRTRGAFGEQLPDNIDVLASALRAGHSFIGALAVVVDDAVEPSRSEYQRVIADEQLGVPLEDALEVVVERMDNRDLEQVAVVAALQRETGGNMAEVLDQVVANVRAKMDVERLVRTLTAQGRLARWILSLLPVFMVIILSVLSPGYFEPLLENGLGRLVLVVTALMIVAGSLVIKRIVTIRL